MSNAPFSGAVRVHILPVQMNSAVQTVDRFPHMLLGCSKYKDFALGSIWLEKGLISSLNETAVSVLMERENPKELRDFGVRSENRISLRLSNWLQR